jgi:hypothetical protein
VANTLTGTLHYDEERGATGTMTYKHTSLESKLDEVAKGIAKLDVNLKLVPDVDGRPKIAQLVGYNLQNIHVHGAWEGPARLHLIPHMNCRIADTVAAGDPAAEGLSDVSGTWARTDPAMTTKPRAIAMKRMGETLSIVGPGCGDPINGQEAKSWAGAEAVEGVK